VGAQKKAEERCFSGRYCCVSVEDTAVLGSFVAARSNAD